MDPSKYMWNVLLLSMMISSVLCNTRHLLSSLDCKRLTVDQGGSKIKWSGAALTNCRIDISKQDFKDDQTCFKMKSIYLLKSSNKVTFRSSFMSTLKVWDRDHSYPSFIATCTYLYTPYIEINTVSSFGESFELEVYTSDYELSSDVQSAVVTVGAIVTIVIGVIVLIIIVLVVAVYCCCIKSRHSPKAVKRSSATTATVVINQHHMVTQDHTQDVYPPQQQITIGDLCYL